MSMGRVCQADSHASRRAVRSRLTLPLALTILAVSVAPAYALDGVADPTFDGPSGTGNGKFTIPLNGTESDSAVDVAVQADGKIIAAGWVDTMPGGAFDSRFALVRLNPDGTLDSSFDGDATMPGFPGNGIVTTDVGAGEDDFIESVATGGGKIVVAGGADTLAGATTDYDFGVARYSATDGSLDASFDGDGKVTTPMGNAANAQDTAFAVAIQPLNGKIVAAGEAGITVGMVTNPDFAAVRYNANGSLDTNADADMGTHFDADGKLTLSMSTSAALGDFAEGIAIQADNKIVLAGTGRGPDNDFALARLHQVDGSLDTNADSDAAVHLDSDGKLLTSFGSGTSDAANDVTVQPDGRLVAAGTSDLPGETSFALARYNPADGTLDPSFDGDATMPGFPGDGKVVTSFGAGTTPDFAEGVALQADGRILAGGRADIDPTAGSDFDFALARYNGSDGSLDPLFAGDGTLTDRIAAPTGTDQFFDIAVDTSGRVIGAGRSGTPLDFALARYGSDGSSPAPTPTPVTPALVPPPAAENPQCAGLRAKLKKAKSKKKKRKIRRRLRALGC